ncbi:hypothetical protein ACFOE1_03660 [Agromyces mediolanus]|uniref:Uncharacterized protein n=1 Tax=Agromyces mediolanus TaxID=41986 RepID=A0A918FCS2_AGRME|nr:hypothetical protein [Agromyces mediolanus]GGR31041.1 hypothetical protein GCM10010196_26490 [Agromyces mediolanus]GLJ72445.1 hypothetical protein GCM10017583_17010 [Agromyces mediolanus]
MESDRVKHLELVQAVITRQAGNSFVIKGWSLTVSAAFLAFAADRGDPLVVTLAFLPIFGFAFLDAYFLRQERLFRELYKDAISASPAMRTFDMDTSGFQDPEAFPRSRWSSVLMSGQFVVFHGVIALVAYGLLLATLTPCLVEFIGNFRCEFGPPFGG